MNNLVSSKPTINSKEIAELVESQHGNVRTSIERLAKKGVIELPPLQKVEDKESVSPNNKSNVYVFSGEQGKRDSIIVVAQLSPEFTARLVDRWQELEQKASQPVSPARLALIQATALVDLEERQALQEARTKLLQHEVEAIKVDLEKLDTATDHFTILGWHRWRNAPTTLTLADASKMGRKASSYCKRHGITVGSVPDPRFGVACTYPKEVLDDLFLAQVSAVQAP